MRRSSRGAWMANSDAYEVIVTRYQRGLFNVALRMLGNYEDARDATQNRVRQGVRASGQLQPGAAVLQLAVPDSEERVPERAARRGGRRSRCHWTCRPASGADPVEVRERHQAVQAALLALSMEYREVVVLRHFTDLSYDEIAATLGIPAKTVKSRLYTARQQLGEMLDGWRRRTMTHIQRRPAWTSPTN